VNGGNTVPSSNNDSGLGSFSSSLCYNSPMQGLSFYSNQISTKNDNSSSGDDFEEKENDEKVFLK
jgi:hypothetical protein